MRPGTSLATLLILAIGAIGCGPPGAERTPRSPGPNVILIVVDALRADHLSQYGYALDTSSALAPLTDRATRFDETYSPAPWTAPAVASIFSGIAPARHGVDRVGAALGQEIPTLAEVLRNAGWDTGAFSFNPHVSRVAQFDQGFDEFLGYRGGAGDTPDIRAMTREAWRFVASARSPFFLYLQPMNVHGPYRVPPDAESILLGRAPVSGFEYFGPLMKGLMNEGRLELRDEVTPRLLTSLTEQYDTAIRHTAEELGSFFDRLDDAGLWEDALVVLAADHGEELYDHGGFAHRHSLHREVLRVPLFVKLPGQARAASTATPVSLLDIYATLLETLGLEPRPTDGVSLAPLLDPGAAVPAALTDRSLVAEATSAARCAGRALRRGQHDLLVIEQNYEGLESSIRLFDVDADEGQQRDVAAEKPALVAEMLRELADRVATFESDALPRQSYPLSNGERAALERLGYF